jgi:hypothetical protein
MLIPPIAVSDTLTGDSHVYCWQHFNERLGQEEELFAALLEYLSERQRLMAENADEKTAG